MSYPTMSPWCPPQGGGGGGGTMFPPICGPQMGPPATFQPPCPQPTPPQQPQQQVGAWTANGTVVEPRCFFQTQRGDTCPPRRCDWSVFMDCGQQGTAFHQPPCIKIPEPNTHVGDTCPRTICTQWHVGCPVQPQRFVGAQPGPTPTATFPPVCYQQPMPQYQQPAQMPTIYPNYTCGFVCNTQFCAPQQFHAAGPTPTATFPPVCYQQPAQPQFPQPQFQQPPFNDQFGAQFHGTLVSPRCLRTIDVVVCQPTVRGDTCPRTICTSWGVGCPPQPMQPWQQMEPWQQQQQQVGAFTATITMTYTPRCMKSFVPGCVDDPGPNTVRGDTCPAGLCSIYGIGCPLQPRPQQPLPWPQWPMPGMAQQQPQQQFAYTMTEICMPTLYSATCAVCPPTFGCPPPAPAPMQAANVTTPTVIGNTCPFFICQPTFQFCPPQ